jgi:hypothetical protein
MIQLLGSAALPPAESIRDKAAEVVSREYYEIEVAPPSSGPPLLFVIIEWLLTPFIWLFEALEGMPDFLRWIIVVGLALLCLGLIIHIIYSFVVAIRGPSRRSRAAFKLGESRDVPPEDLECEAERARSAGDYIGAIRLLLRAALRRIEVAEDRKFRPGLTNRELLRRYRSSPIFPALERMIETIDLKWYGGQTCLAQDYVACQAEHERIRQAVERVRHAHHA